MKKVLTIILLLASMVMAGPAFADRLVTSGFEMNSATAGVENQLETVTGTAFTVQGTTVRSGSYAAKFLPSSTNGYATYNFTPLATGGTIYNRFYLYIQASPATDTYIMKGKIAAGTVYYGVKLTTTNTLQLTNGSTQIGSDSAALSGQTWYRIETAYTYATGAVEIKINGAAAFASGTTTSAKAINQIDLGAIDSPASGEWYMDDIAVNNSSGSYQTGYPGEGKILQLMPNGNGSTAAWSCTGGQHWQSLDEIPPDGPTSICSTSTAGVYEQINFTNPGYTQGSTITLVHTSLRAERSSAGSGSVSVGTVGDCLGGTGVTGNATGSLGTSWITNTVTAPRLATLTMYVQPNDNSTAWGDTCLNDLQISLYLATAGGRTAQVSTVWATVEYTEPAQSAGDLEIWHKSSTTTSFKMGIDQNSTTGDPTIEDRFYISEEYIGSEPERTPDATLTTLGHTEVEFTGLQPDRFYYVYAVRYMNSAFHSKAVGYNSLTNGFTLPATQRVTADSSDVVYDWSQGYIFRYLIPNPLWDGADTSSRSQHTVEADASHDLGGDYYLNWVPTAITYANAFATGRVNFDQTENIEFSFKMRVTTGAITSGFTSGGFEAVAYASETEYAGLICNPADSGSTTALDCVFLCGDGTCNWDSQADPMPSLARDTVYTWKISKNNTLRNFCFYIDDALIGCQAKSWDLIFPQRLWLVGPANGSTGTVQVGPITMKGKQVWGNVDFSYAPFWEFTDRTKAAYRYGVEKQSTQAGSITATGGIVNGQNYEGGLSQLNGTSSKAGTWVLKTPLLKPQFGYKYKNLEAYAQQKNGTLTIKVKDADGNLVSDSYITGNSTGFTPDGSTKTVIDISSVPYSGIVIETTGYLASDQADSINSPRLQYLGVTFQSGSLVDISIDPVTTPTSSSTQTITGSMGASNTVSVSTNHGSVGTVTYPTSTTWSVDLTSMCGDDLMITATASYGGNNSTEYAFINCTITCSPSTYASRSWWVNGEFAGGALTRSCLINGGNK